MSFNLIKNKCIIDHSKFIHSYIKESQSNIIPQKYQEYTNNCKQTRDLLREIAIMYPSIFAFMLNPRVANVCGQDLMSRINTQTGGAVKDATSVLQSIKNRFADLKLSLRDEDMIRAGIFDIQQKMQDIEDKLKSIDNQTQGNKIKLNIDTVLNNLQQIVTMIQTDQPYKSPNAIGSLVSAPNELIVPLEKNLEFNTALASSMEQFGNKILASSQQVDELLKKIGILLAGTTDQIQKQILTGQNISGSDDNIREMALHFILNKMKSIKPHVSGHIQENKLEDLIALSSDIIDKLSQYTTKNDDNIRALSEAIKNIKLYIEDPTYKKTFTNIRSHFVPPAKIAYLYLLCHRNKADPEIQFLMNEYKKLPIAHMTLYGAINNVINDINSKCTQSTSDLRTNLQQMKANLKNDMDKYIEKVKGDEANLLNTFFKRANKILNMSSSIKNTIAIDVVTTYISVLNLYKTKFEAVSDTVSIANFKIDVASLFSADHEHKEWITIACEIERCMYAIPHIRTLLTKIKPTNVSQMVTSCKEPYSFIMMENGHYEKIKKFLDKLLGELHIAYGNGTNDPLSQYASENFNNWINAYNKAIDVTLRNSSDPDVTLFDEIRANLGLPKIIHFMPSNFFMSIYTKTIKNELFEIGQQAVQTADLLKDLVCGTITQKNMDILYNPDFESVCKVTQSAGGPPKDKEPIEIKKIMLTNTLTSPLTRIIRKDQLTVPNLYEKIKDICEKDARYIKTIGVYNNLVQEYNLAYIDVYCYIRFLILIGTNQYFTSEYILYEYINGGIIEFYKRIFTKMMKDIEMFNMTHELRHIWKEYKLVVIRLNKFFGYLSKEMTDPKIIIDINGIKDPTIRNDFLLFNHFRTIIDSYNELFQNKLTIYARINDIRGDIDFDEKIFVSDYERVLSTTQSKGSITFNSNQLWLVKNQCKSIKQKYTQDLPDKDLPDKDLPDKDLDLPDEKIVVTEVFDSIKFPENSDISKYMTLETQLSKQKSVCIMTYGYSGTGKTYTLFGTAGTPGMLQSTLSNVSGLVQVKFRLFELYGTGFPYSFYWKNNDGTPRTAQINHQIFHYFLETSAEQIIVDKANVPHDIEVIDANNFQDYIQNDKKYIKIERQNISQIFGNFSLFTNEIDNYRKGNIGNNTIKHIRRIRDTPNNKESSRSILVYDFKLYIKDTNEQNSVNFLIIDLPGREIIEKTYIAPYINNQVIGEDIPTIKANQDKLKMILTCMALNPVGLAAFSADEILTVIASHNNPDDINYDYVQKLYEKVLWSKIGAGSTGKFAGWLIRADFPNEYATTNKKGIFSVEIDQTTDNADIDYRVIQINNRLSLNENNDLKLLVDDAKKCITLIHKENKNTIKNKCVFFESTDGNKGYGYERGNMIQIRGTLAIFVMFYLIQDNKIELIEEIYKNIISKEINDPIALYINERTYVQLCEIANKMMTTKFKADLLLDSTTTAIFDKYDVTNKSKTSLDKVELATTLVKLMQYDYLLTPLEGIYINENIMGLIKYLADKLIIDGPSKRALTILKKTEISQPNVTLEDQRNITRTWLMSSNKAFGQVSSTYMSLSRTKSMLNIQDDKYTSGFFVGNTLASENNIYYRMYNKQDGDNKFELIKERLEPCRIKINEQYDAAKLYNFDKPLITDILSKFIDQNDANKNTIKDYKMFYLFGNYEDDTKTQFKCEHQLALLEETKQFVSAIV